MILGFRHLNVFPCPLEFGIIREIFTEADSGVARKIIVPGMENKENVRRQEADTPATFRWGMGTIAVNPGNAKAQKASPTRLEQCRDSDHYLREETREFLGGGVS